jgi:hypothetical protein
LPAARAGQLISMSVVGKVLHPRTFLTRTALAAFAWTHRHEILRWGRSLYDQLVGQSDLSPARAARTGRVLFSIAADDRLRDAKQLRKVSMTGDDVELDVDERWSELPRLVDHVRSVKGVRRVFVNGKPETVVSADAVAS